MHRPDALGQRRSAPSATMAALATALLWTAAGCGPSKPVDTTTGASPPPGNQAAPRRAEPAPAPRSRARAQAAARAVPAKGLRITGRIAATAGQTVPAKAKVALVWVVSSGSPDYVYAFGSGTAKGDRFEVTLTGPPPAAAINAGILGIGMLLLLPARTPVPTGRLSRQQWRTLVRAIVGGADRYGVLYRTPGTAVIKTRSWMGQFTGGYRCGKGFKRPNRTFEGFNPIACTQLLIRLGTFKSLRWVNWT